MKNHPRWKKLSRADFSSNGWCSEWCWSPELPDLPHQLVPPGGPGGTDPVEHVGYSVPAWIKKGSGDLKQTSDCQKHLRNQSYWLLEGDFDPHWELPHANMDSSLIIFFWWISSYRPTWDFKTKKTPTEFGPISLELDLPVKNILAFWDMTLLHWLS